MSESADNIGKRIQCIVTLLMQGAMHFAMNDPNKGLAHLRAASVDLTALQVAVGDLAGPARLPRIRRKRKHK